MKVLFVGLLYMLETFKETPKAPEEAKDAEDISMSILVDPVLANPLILVKAPPTEAVTTGPYNLYTDNVFSRLEVVPTV